MIDIHDSPQHYIQRYILDILRHNEYSRFRDLRPKGVDSNAFSYHLKRLLAQKYVEKNNSGYVLTVYGLSYIDRVSSLNTLPRRQPKIMTITAIYNEDGHVLMRKKATQPMINQLTLPCGMVHLADHTILDAALREIQEKVTIHPTIMHHAGDCYMAVTHDGSVIMNTLMHVFASYVPSEIITPNDEVWWHDPLDHQGMAPASKHILSKLWELEQKGSRDRFFEEYTENW